MNNSNQSPASRNIKVGAPFRVWRKERDTYCRVDRHLQSVAELNRMRSGGLADPTGRLSGETPHSTSKKKNEIKVERKRRRKLYEIERLNYREEKEVSTVKKEPEQ